MIDMKRANRAFAVDMAKAMELDQKKSLERNLPVTAREVEKLHPVSVLKQYILKWPPRDVRYDRSISARVQSSGKDSVFMRHMFEGMDLEILSADPSGNMVEVGVFFQSNMAEFERYNTVAYHHNLKWLENGMKEEVFDPVHGNITPVTDQFVDYAKADSKYISRPDRNPFNTRSSGALTQARPQTSRTMLLRIVYKLDIINNSFHLGYVAHDYRDRIVYFNKITGDNLSDLTRRSTQELFGHPFIYSDSGPFLDGISLLIQGKKLGICRRDNIEPNWMSGKTKDFNVALNVSKTMEIIFQFAEYLFSILFPLILLVWGIILKVLPTLERHGPYHFLIQTTVVLVLMYFSVTIGSYFKKEAASQSLIQKKL